VGKDLPAGSGITPDRSRTPSQRNCIVAEPSPVLRKSSCITGERSRLILPTRVETFPSRGCMTQSPDRAFPSQFA